ncbi:unnamed protein product [Chilo suppressalis]|uniref:CCAAT-binding factor domain-containing protein n=1 Tax=Chilo suppressalis TaxID=168631 RepID=A0ABN8LD29_CHISP|nr:unnamed protein product [Chilo suppressalis]
MADDNPNLLKMVSTQLRNKANEFLNSRKHANNLADLLQMFQATTDNYTPLLLTIEVIFTELLRRGDLIEEIVPLKPIEQSPEAEYTRWLRDCYETALNQTLECIKRGRMNSRLQALVTNIFTVLLDSEQSMSAPIARFQEFTEYRDVQQYGLKVLSTLAYRKSPSSTFMQNYLELLDKLLITEIQTEAKCRIRNRNNEEKEEKILCGAEGKAPFPYNPGVCRRYANRCWNFACQWALCAEPRTHRRALLLLVERLMPILTRPYLATDMLCDSLDAGGPISILALQGVLELVRRHNVTYPDMYDRLYALLEPEMFHTRCKRRLLHLTDVFLSSTHLPESLVAAFAKLSSDPYVMEETSASRSRALGSSLWEVSALRRHHCPSVQHAAARVLQAAAPRAAPLPLAPAADGPLFDAELKKRFKTIEMNFIRPQGMTAPSGERLMQFWELMA